MIDPFRRGIDAVFERMGQKAHWFQGGWGAGLGCRVIPRAADEETSFGGTRLISDAMTLKVRVSEINAPSENDAFEIEGQRYIVQGVPTRDARRLVWSMEARPA
ncbi:head-tail joining protein [Limimaricola pyoseonensis]|uniref:Head-tail adaptor n=1 Tax=Limimaricola pyoseonensis TaxID=521013 RepID=A0A1G7GQB7_9RHOB|nr:hypothetical protein [Limimaricola pyoseonensis]SDE90243.1 hypothetical protein SAMN04488567_2877 [Limimaricola pyoseonensis]